MRQIKPISSIPAIVLRSGRYCCRLEKKKNLRRSRPDPLKTRFATTFGSDSTHVWAVCVSTYLRWKRAARVNITTRRKYRKPGDACLYSHCCWRKIDIKRKLTAHTGVLYTRVLAFFYTPPRRNAEGIYFFIMIFFFFPPS